MGHFSLLVTKTDKLALHKQIKPTKGHWDWFQVGGRFGGYFLLHKGASGRREEIGALGVYRHAAGVDIAAVKDIDWLRTEAANRELANNDWNGYEAEKAGDDTVNRRVFGIREGETKAQYITRRASVATFAVLHRGRWYQKMSIGLDGLLKPTVNEKALKEWEAQFTGIIQSLDPDDEVTVVDCHF